MEKHKPRLPEAVAAVYDCKIVPTVIELRKPEPVKYDLTKISLEQAHKLVDLTKDKYLVKKAAVAKAEAKTEK